MGNGFFDRVEKKTNVKKEDILSLAKSIQYKDLSNEDEIRQLISDVGELADNTIINPIDNNNNVVITSVKSTGLFK